MKTIFDNPLYDPRYPETGVPPASEDDPSKLPPDHPDFESTSYCPPKLLFPEAHVKSRRKRQTGRSASEVAASDHDGDGDESELPALDVTERTLRGKGKGKSSELAAGAELHEPPKRVGKGKGKAMAHLVTPEPRRTRAPPKKPVKSEWDSSDDEAGYDDRGDAGTPPGRIPVPHDMVRVPKEAAPAKPEPKEERPVIALRRSPRLHPSSKPPSKSEEPLSPAKRTSRAPASRASKEVKTKA